MNNGYKTVMYVILLTIMMMLWLKTDPGSDEDDPDIVSIDYRCSLLNQYKYVPDDVITECASRINPMLKKGTKDHFHNYIENNI